MWCHGSIDKGYVVNKVSIKIKEEKLGFSVLMSATPVNVTYVDN